MEVQPTLVSHTIKLYKQNLKNKSIISQLNTINYDLYDNKKLILNLLNTDTAIINDLIINKSAILGYDIKKDDYDYSIVNKKYVDSLVSHAVDPSRTLYLTNPDISLKCDGNIECYNNLIVSNCINTDKINCTDDINIYGNIFIKNINDPYTIKLSNNNILLLNDDIEILKYTANNNTFTSNIDLIIHGNIHFDNINIKNINISGLINNLNINDMNNEIKNNTSDITTINEEISDLSERIDTNTSDIITINEEISDLTNKISTNTSNITTINGKITDLSGRIDTNTSDITTINEEISDLTNKISTNTSNITTINGKITDLSGRIDTNTSDITTINEEITNLSGRIDTNTSDITIINGNITDLTNKISTNTSDITTIKQDITNLKQQDETINSDLTNYKSIVESRTNSQTGEIITGTIRITNASYLMTNGQSSNSLVNKGYVDDKVNTAVLDKTQPLTITNTITGNNIISNSKFTGQSLYLNTPDNPKMYSIYQNDDRSTLLIDNFIDTQYNIISGKKFIFNTDGNRDKLSYNPSTNTIDVLDGDLTLNGDLISSGIKSNGVSSCTNFVALKTPTSTEITPENTAYRVRYEQQKLLISHPTETRYDCSNDMNFVYAAADGKTEKLKYTPSTNTIDVLNGNLTLNGSYLLLTNGSTDTSLVNKKYIDDKIADIVLDTTQPLTITNRITGDNISSKQSLNCMTFLILDEPTNNVTVDNTKFRIQYNQPDGTIVTSNAVNNRWDLNNNSSLLFGVKGSDPKIQYTASNNTFEVLNGNLILNGSYSLPTNGTTDTSLINKKYVDDKVKTGGIDTTQPLTITNTITGNNIKINGGELQILNSQGRLLETTRQHKTYKIATSIFDNKVYDIENNSHIILKSNAQTEKLKYTPSTNTIDVLDGDLTLNGSYLLPTSGSTDTSLINKKYVDDKVKTAGIDTTQPLTITNTIKGNNIVVNANGTLKLNGSLGAIMIYHSGPMLYFVSKTYNKTYCIDFDKEQVGFRGNTLP